VKFSLMPSPERAITTPSYACRRWVVPSMTLTMTLTVSPAPNSGTPRFAVMALICSFSSSAMMFIVDFPFLAATAEEHLGAIPNRDGHGSCSPHCGKD
jgi:hypothetical protein